MQGKSAGSIQVCEREAGGSGQNYQGNGNTGI